MLTDIGDIIGQVLVRGNVTTTAATNGLYTDTILNNWIDDAHKWAAGRHKWPFTEGRVSTTYVSNTEEYTYPENWRSDSIRLLQVGGKMIQKIAFNDYQIYREQTQSGTDKVYTDFGRTYFINPDAGVSGTITLYGQFMPSNIDTTDDAATTVFSNADGEGNEAIVEEMLKYANEREKKFDEALVHHNKAIEILETIWKKITEEQFGYEAKDRNMWERFDVLSGETTDELFQRDRWY